MNVSFLPLPAPTVRRPVKQAQNHAKLTFISLTDRLSHQKSHIFNIFYNYPTPFSTFFILKKKKAASPDGLAAAYYY